MCVICVSNPGVQQPSIEQLRNMFDSNPHGAGYMVARNGRVEISKGFMDFDTFLHAVQYERFTEDDSVVYHFRISTQAGTTPEMTHPFPLTSNICKTRMLDVACPIGVAHNGIIRLTSDPHDKDYSDTAHYIAEFLRYLVRSPADLRNGAILDAIERTTNSRWALMDATGYVATVGNFIEDDGLLFSNASYFPPRHFSFYGGHSKNQIIRGFFDDEPQE